MKIILTNSFQENFEKEFKNYNFQIAKFVAQLKKVKLINLDKPYCKVKIRLNWIPLRWIVIFNDIWNMIPVYFVLKKDKTTWENLSLTKTVLVKLDSLLWIYSWEFANNNFKTY